MCGLYSKGPAGRGHRPRFPPTLKETTQEEDSTCLSPLFPFLFLIQRRRRRRRRCPTWLYSQIVCDDTGQSHGRAGTNNNVTTGTTLLILHPPTVPLCHHHHSRSRFCRPHTHSLTNQRTNEKGPSLYWFCLLLLFFLLVASSFDRLLMYSSTLRSHHTILANFNFSIQKCLLLFVSQTIIEQTDNDDLVTNYYNDDDYNSNNNNLLALVYLTFFFPLIWFIVVPLSLLLVLFDVLVVLSTPTTLRNGPFI